MRDLFKVLQKYRIPLSSIAENVGTSVRNIQNFVNGEKSPTYEIWCLYYEYAYSLFAEAARNDIIMLLKKATGQYGNIALAALKDSVPDTASDTKIIIDNYVGNYLTYSWAYLNGYVNVTWVRVFYDNKRRAVGFDHQYRTGLGSLIQTVGYIVPTDRTLHFIGSVDSTSYISMAIINRNPAPEDDFEFLRGIYLSVTRERKPFASKIIMKRLPNDAKIENYDKKIKATCAIENRLFEENEEEFEKRLVFLGEMRKYMNFMNNETSDREALKL